MPSVNHLPSRQVKNLEALVGKVLFKLSVKPEPHQFRHPKDVGVFCLPQWWADVLSGQLQKSVSLGNCVSPHHIYSATHFQERLVHLEQVIWAL